MGGAVQVPHFISQLQKFLINFRFISIHVYSNQRPEYKNQPKLANLIDNHVDIIVIHVQSTGWIILDAAIVVIVLNRRQSVLHHDDVITAQRPGVFHHDDVITAQRPGVFHHDDVITAQRPGVLHLDDVIRAHRQGAFRYDDVIRAQRLANGEAANQRGRNLLAQLFKTKLN